MMTIPNIIDPTVPIGRDDSENVEVERFGEPVVPVSYTHLRYHYLHGRGSDCGGIPRLTILIQKFDFDELDWPKLLKLDI